MLELQNCSEKTEPGQPVMSVPTWGIGPDRPRCSFPPQSGCGSVNAKWEDFLIFFFWKFFFKDGEWLILVVVATEWEQYLWILMS